MVAAAVLPLSLAGKSDTASVVAKPTLESKGFTVENNIAASRVLQQIVLATPMPPQSPTSNKATDLERILVQMDSTAEKFRTIQAVFVWEHYQKVVEESESQKGKIYFRRSGTEIQMAADVVEPDPKYVVLSEGKIQLYQPRIEQVTVYNLEKHREQFESFLVLGFGAGGHDMLKSYDVQYLGTENAGGVAAAKLDLAPKAPNVRNNVSHIVLWIDPAKGVSVQQQFFEPSGDYRLTKYSDIQLNQKLTDNLFKLKTTRKTQFVSPQGP